MIAPSISYKGHRFPRELIAHAVWLYIRFNLSLCEVEEMLRARDLGFIRNDPSLDPQIWTVDRTKFTPTAGAFRRRLAFG